MLGDAGVDPTDPLVLAKGVEGADDDTGSADRVSVLGTGPLEHATTASEIKAEPASRYIFTSESARLYWRHKQQNASSGTRESEPRPQRARVSGLKARAVRSADLAPPVSDRRTGPGVAR
jgi:hypothetical protein